MRLKLKLKSPIESGDDNIAETRRQLLEAAGEVFAEVGFRDATVREICLRAFVESLLRRIFDTGPTAWHGKLMMREMIDPTTALDSIVEEKIRPMAGQLRQVVAEILDCPVEDDSVRLCSFSIVSQC